MKVAAVDLFCGVGGLTYGLRNGGIPVTAGIDAMTECEYPYESNNNADEPGHDVDCDVEFIRMDLADLSNIDIEEDIGSLFGDADIRILAGCAPCQAFSPYNHGQEANAHEDYDLLGQFAEIVSDLEPSPQIVTMENTYEVRHADVYERFVDTLDKEGYYLPTEKEAQRDAFRVYCPEYGVPQTRRRWVLLASQFGKVELKEPTYEDEDEFPDVESTIGHLIEPEDEITTEGVEPENDLHRTRTLIQRNKERIAISEPGETWRLWEEKGRKDLLNECHKRESGSSFDNTYGRMEWNKPAPTITTKFVNYGSGRFGHPEYHDDHHPENVNRPISLLEGALLQTFPEHYEFAEDHSSITQDLASDFIGNAVPPKLAEHIADTILSHLATQFPEVESFRSPTGTTPPERDFIARVQQPGD